MRVPEKWGGPTPMTVKVAEVRLSGEPRVNAAELKAGFAVAPDYYALDADAGPDVKGVAPGEVVEESRRQEVVRRLDVEVEDDGIEPASAEVPLARGQAQVGLRRIREGRMDEEAFHGAAAILAAPAAGRQEGHGMWDVGCRMSDVGCRMSDSVSVSVSATVTVTSSQDFEPFPRQR